MRLRTTLSQLLAWANMRKLYELKVPCFLANDLELSEACFPPKAVVRKGKQRVVRMQRGQRVTRPREPIKDEYFDEEGNLF